MSPKGRGSNEARTNRRLADRKGRGTQSGTLRRAPEAELGWWARFLAWLKRLVRRER